MKKIILPMLLLMSSQVFAQEVNVTTTVSPNLNLNGGLNNAQVNSTSNSTSIVTTTTETKVENKEVKPEKKLGHYQAYSTDSSVMALVRRWAEDNQKTLYWDADTDVEINNFKSFNSLLLKSGVDEQSTLRNALNKTLKIASYKKTAEASLKLCPFNDADRAIVVRPITISCD